jgi:undecaprenyl-diphosphatase
MSVFEAIFLGIVQGLSEFLPISSTGHLTVAGKLLNLISEDNPERWTAFIAVIQLGTLAAIFVYFWKDLLEIVKSFLSDNLIQRKKFTDQEFYSKLGWYIIFGSIPIIIVGLGFKDIIEGAFTKNLYVIAYSLIALGVILAIAEWLGKFKKDLQNINWISAVLIGLAQTLALIPGSSRSGTTITAGLFLGFTRETAARFSFLLSVPAVLGSGVLQFIEVLEFIDYKGFVVLIIATITSAVSGYLAISFLLNYLKKNSLYIFVFYRIILGVIILLLIHFQIIIP